MSHAEQILTALDRKLDRNVDLTLYGRAAIHLGFENAPHEVALSRDIDAVLWLGQAEDLLAETNFWQAVDQINNELADQELFISHFFTEDQVILRPDWKEHRVSLSGRWSRLSLYRLSDLDLLLSKLMRDDPIDQADARFIVSAANFQRHEIEAALLAARVPDIPEIQEQYELSTKRLLCSLR